MINTRVRDLMRPNLIACSATTRLGEAAQMLTRHRVHALVVADATGMPLGLVSDFDLLAGDWLSDDAANLAARRAMTVGEAMVAPAAVIDAGAPASEAAARLFGDRTHHLVVTDMDRAVGVISVSDLVGGLAKGAGVRRSVADAMSHGLVICRAETSLAGAARVMSDRRSRALVVVSARGLPLGVVTGHDLLGYAAGGDASDPVTTVMHPPITVGAAASLREAAALLLHHRVHRLVVVDPAEPDSLPLGLISTSDLLLELAPPAAARRGA